MNNYQILINKLDAFIRKYYKNQLLKGGIYAVSLVLASFVLFTSVEYFAQFNILGRTILFYCFFLIVAYVMAYYIILPISKLYKFGKIINHEQAADIIGKHFTEVKDKLTNVLQLNELSFNNPNQLVLASIDQKSAELKPVSFANAVDFTENKRYWKIALFPLLFLLFISIFSPEIFKVGTSRLVNHNSIIKPVAPFEFNIKNTTLSVLKNKDFNLEVEISGNQLPDKVFLVQNGMKTVLTKVDKRNFSHTFKNVIEPLKFNLLASGFESEEFFLNVLPNPLLTNFKVHLDYPKYIGKQNEILNNIGDFTIPEGTKIKWEFFTEDADNILFSILDTSFNIQSNNQKVTFNTVAKISTNYAVLPINKLVSAPDTLKYAFQVVKDQFPTIDVEETTDSTNNKRIYFKGLINDDYGFSGLSFHVKIVTVIDSLPNRNEPQQVFLPFNKANNADEFFHFWNLETLNILPGDEIVYYFEVFDNDGVNGRKSAKSAVKTLKTRTIKELDESINKSNESIKSLLTESINDAKKLQKELNDLKKKLTDKKELGWEEKKKIKDLLEKQKELEQKINELTQENQKNNNQQNEFKPQNEELLKKQEQLQKLFDELMTDEMKEMMKKLEEMMQKLDKNMLGNELEKMDLSNKDLEKELDRSLELFKQLEFEQKLEDVKNKLEKLADKQDKLAEQTEQKKTTNEDLNTKQEELSKEFDELKKDLDELKKKDEELERPKGMEDTKEKQNNISEEMKKGSEQLQNNKNKKAAESQKSAAEMMEELADDMKAMQSSSSESVEDMESLRQLLDNLLYISFQQEDLMEKFNAVKNESPEYVKLVQKQKNLKDDAKMVEDSLFALSKRVVQLESAINKEISAVNFNMQKAIEFMAERLKPMATSKQQYVMTSINNLALLFDEALQQMQQQAKQKPGEGSCDKPGSNGKPKPGAAASMKKLQEQLNKQLEDLKKALEEGKKPGPKPGENPMNIPGGQGGSSESFAKMASEQAKIREQLQKMRESMDQNGKNGINQLSKLMEETETDLVNKRITQQTINRQQEILTRLLESEKAERERELDDKRESKQGLDKPNSNPEEFFKYNMKKESEVELLKTTPPNFNNFYKNKVSMYFQNLSK
ncbi:MAG: hypothetical protein AB7O47_01170 [Flavobacteriales bacterium]